uniref:Uncharacterized protein n=1 Tax=Monopterus albus TaxID=43700 RepID=A0A3Q3IHS7_MONAL
KMKAQFIVPLTVLLSVGLLGIMKLRKKEEEIEERRNKFLDIKLRVSHDVQKGFFFQLSGSPNLAFICKTLKFLMSCNDTGETDKEAASWKTELETLNQQMAAQSAACKYLKKGSQEGSKLCGIEVKAEAPKQEEPKAEAPKKEEPKAEAPKKEEPKAEAPKQEEPKPEHPNVHSAVVQVFQGVE